MLKVISNSTPIIALKRIENLNLLGELYDKIIVPYGVSLTALNTIEYKMK